MYVVLVSYCVINTKVVISQSIQTPIMTFFLPITIISDEMKDCRRSTFFFLRIFIEGTVKYASKELTPPTIHIGTCNIWLL